MKRASIWFSLFIEASKKIRIAAAILTAFYVMSNVILFGAYTSTYLHSWILNIEHLSALSALYIYPAGLVFGLMSFSYLNKRKSSDFYHAIPTTRTKLYLASYAAGASEMFISVALCYAIIPIVLDNGCVFNPYDLVLSAFYTFFAAMMIFSAVLAACSFTGTLFSNLAAAAIIVWLPCVVRLVLGLVFEEFRGFDGELPFVFNPMINFSTGIFFSLLGLGTRFSPALYSVGYWAFNLLILAAYTAGGLLLFNKRRSETAGHTAPGNRIQNIMAALLATFCTFVLSGLAITGKISPFDEEALLAGLIAVTMFMVYQAVAYRNMFKMVKSLPWLFCSVIVSFALCWGTAAVASSMERGTLDHENIEGVYIVSDRNSNYYSSYYAQRVEEVNVSEPELNKIVAEAVNKSNSYDYNIKLISQPMSFELFDGKDFSQTVHIPYAQYSRVNEILAKNEAYMKAVNSVPPEDSIKMIRLFKDRHMYFDVDVDTQKLYESLLAEGARARSYNDIYYTYPAEIVKEPAAYDDYSLEASISSLYVYGYEGLESYLDEYSINPITTPKTADMLLPIVNELANEARDLDNVNYILVDLYSADGERNAASWNESVEEELREITEQIKELLGKMKFANKSADRMIKVKWEGYKDDNGYTWHTADCWLAPTDDQFAELSELCNELQKLRIGNDIPGKYVG